MDKNHIINEILRIPERLVENPNKSFHAVVSEFRHFFTKREITDDDLRIQLIQSPSLVQQWLTYSEDKRVSSGWFFRRLGSQKYEVGFCMEKGNIANTSIFDDALKACALFICKEMENYIVINHFVTPAGTVIKEGQSLTDWRLQGQEKYLQGVVLYRKKYTKPSDDWDHDHCRFCWKKFSAYEGDEKEGYTTEDNYYWICSDCFTDFQQQFKWQVVGTGR